MILTIDVGNTNIVLGVFDGDKLTHTSRISSNRNCTSDEFAVILKAMFDIYGFDTHSFDGSIISSVVPQITQTLVKSIELVLKKTPLVVGPGMKTGLNIKIDDPAQLGSDFIVDSVAAIAKYPKPIIVIDMGTATTLSVINERNEFIGGAILPGVRISLDALSQKTAQLPSIAFLPPKRVIGRNTVDCMQSGIVLGNASMLDGMIDRFEQELGKKCSLVATGGLAPVIASHANHNIEIDDDLLLDGLRILYEMNKRS